MKEIFEKYKRVVLLYSGGKDSLAVLLLCKPYWDKLTVVFVDTGVNFPEIYDHMEKVKKLVHEFVTIKSNGAQYFYSNGFPVDVVPTRYTNDGLRIYGDEKFKCCSRYDCCKENLWKPVDKFFQSDTADCLLLGDRSFERTEGVSEVGHVHIERPIFDWTTKQVMQAISRDTDDLFQANHFLLHNSSLDCMHCTSGFEGMQDRIAYLKKHHPNVIPMYTEFFKHYKKAVSKEMAKLGDSNELQLG